MPITYAILPDQKLAYMKAYGHITVEDIMLAGAKILAENEWANGYYILCDYREVTTFALDADDIRKIVDQDKRHEPLLDKSKCAVVADKEHIYGFSRMWEILSEGTLLTTEVFRDIDDAIGWLGIPANSLNSVEKLLPADSIE